MKSKLTYIIAGICSFLIIGAGSVYAKGSCLAQVDRIPGMTLTDAQKATLETKEAEFKKKMIKLRADHAVARVDKDELMKNKNFKKEDVQKQIKKMMAIETDMEMARLDSLDDLRKILTDEQWAVFASHMDNYGPFKGGHCLKKGDAAQCPAGYGKGKDMGMGHGHNADYGKGAKDCPYSNPSTTN